MSSRNYVYGYIIVLNCSWLHMLNLIGQRGKTMFIMRLGVIWRLQSAENPCRAVLLRDNILHIDWNHPSAESTFRNFELTKSTCIFLVDQLELVWGT